MLTVHAELPPRLSQTLQYLLEGLSEKEVAYKLGISQHTVHIYVKQLYRRFDVRSRGELMSTVFRQMLAQYQEQAGIP